MAFADADLPDRGKRFQKVISHNRHQIGRLGWKVPESPSPYLSNEVLDSDLASLRVSILG
jgi:hypothetical protein